jgi:Glycosyl transferase family 11
MIIISELPGDHSNRLFQSIHYEAYCLDRGMKFLNLTFGDMASNYPAVKFKLEILPLWLYVKLLLKIKPTLLRKDFKVKADLDRAANGRLILVGGFDFRVHSLTEKYRDYFVKKYSIEKKKVIGNSLNSEIAHWKANGATVVGVHMRRGDYKRFKNGIYFYSDAVYEKIMRAVQASLAESGARAKFLLFSNEDFSISPDGSLDYAFSRNDWLTDHHLMSQCDYLVGPPSTFTLWASYIGKVPVHHVYDPAAPIEMSRFDCCIG